MLSNRTWLYNSPCSSVLRNETISSAFEWRKTVSSKSFSIWLLTASVSVKEIAKLLASVLRNSHVMLVRKYDLPLAVAPTIDKNSGGISLAACGMRKWQRGQAMSGQLMPAASTALPSGVNRDGRKRNAASAPNTGSPIRL